MPRAKQAISDRGKQQKGGWGCMLAILSVFLLSYLGFGWLVVTLVFVAVGAGGIWFDQVRAMRKARKPVSQSMSPGLDPALQRAGYLPAYRAGNEPVTLKPPQTRWTRLLKVVLVAAFCNGGMVSVFIVQGVEVSGQLNWFMTIVMIPFVVVGAAAIGAVVYFALALFNPQLILTVNREAVPLGGTLDLAWNMIGKAHRMRQLSVFLEGREYATYRRGTNTRLSKRCCSTPPTSLPWPRGLRRLPSRLTRCTRLSVRATRSPGRSASTATCRAGRT